jgi:hypothetical protein
MQPALAVFRRNNTEVLMLRLLLFFLIPAACSSHQQSAARDSNADNPAKEYQGCVIRSGGNILLTTPANKDFRLTRASASTSVQLDTYVGDEVKITATQTTPQNPASPAAEAGAGNTKQGPPTLEVAEITKVSEHCSSPHEENLPKQNDPGHP